jgi:hypothetical protein
MTGCTKVVSRDRLGNDVTSSTLNAMREIKDDLGTRNGRGLAGMQEQTTSENLIRTTSENPNSASEEIDLNDSEITSVMKLQIEK